MRNDTTAIRKRLVILGVLAVGLVLCVQIFVKRSNPYTFAASNSGVTTVTSQPPISNAAVLQNWLPQAVYDETLRRVYYYLSQNDLTPVSLSVKGTVSFSPNTYDFDLVTQPQNQSLGITVTVTNYDSVLSTAVTINTQLQTPQIPSNQQPGTTPRFSGTDALVNVGVTARQINSLQAALVKFSSTAASFDIDSVSIKSPPVNPNYTAPPTYAFIIRIDSTPYNAKLICPGLASAQLILNDQVTGRQVFDSGTISS